MAHQIPPRTTQDLILATIKRRVEDEAKIVIEEAKKKLEERVPEIVAGTIIEVMENPMMEQLGSRITFSIEQKV